MESGAPLALVAEVLAVVPTGSLRSPNLHKRKRIMRARKVMDIDFPVYLLDEGYRPFLTSRLGRMVFRTLSGLVNNRQRLSSLTLMP